jgi:hypothetical protein
MWYDISVSEGHAASIFRVRMEAAWPSKMCHMPEDDGLNLQHHENLKSCNLINHLTLPVLFLDE